MPITGTTGTYLFCLARNGASAPGAGLSPETPVSFDVVHGITSVTCEVDLADFCGTTGEGRLQDLAWVAPRAVQHEAVVERIMRASPVLPARFGTIFSSLGALHAFIVEHRDAILPFLDFVADKEEWSIKGLLDTDLAIEALARRGGGVPLLASTPGARYLQIRRRRVDLASEAAAWAEEQGHVVLAELDACAVKARTLGAMSASAAGRAHDVVLNLALLVRQTEVEGFRARVARLAESYRDQGLSIEASGPWPPYRFCPSLGTRTGGP